MESYSFQIITGIISTIVGGLLLAGIIFFLDEYLFSVKNLTGKWELVNLCQHSAYNPYKGLSLHYRLHLLQTGTTVSGSAEKIKETRADGEEVRYTPPIRVSITGTIHRKILKRSTLALHTSEEGIKRTSTVSYVLTIKKKNIISGVFFSSSAESSGISTWEKIV